MAGFAYSSLALGANLLLLVAVLILSLGQSLLPGADPYRCHALLDSGTWLDDAQSKWQPEGCLLHSFSAPDVTSCMANRRMLFIGDSTVRLAFYASARVLDPELDTTAPKHSDRELILQNGIHAEFLWDPYLNRTDTLQILRRQDGNSYTEPPALLVIGAGLWYLRNYEPSVAMALWAQSMDRLFDYVADDPYTLADQVVILPVEQVIESKLSEDRRATLHSSSIDAMNADLDDRLARHHLISRPSTSLPDTLSMPRIFNTITRTSPIQTDDGMHFSSPISNLQADILYNLRCTDYLSKTFPLDKTCCSRYPSPNYVQRSLLFFYSVLIPGILVLVSLLRSKTFSRLLPPKEMVRPVAIIGVALGLCYLADRTSYFQKEHKSYDAAAFAFLMFSALAVGLGTVKNAGKDLGFLNRDQTDEWKGWMQIAILIYHYLGASKISGIYNPIRVLVAAYLFQSGYGHFYFYYKKADFGFSRVVSVLVRLNLLTIGLEYTMGTDYLSYYFSPLVTMWFGIIWIVMYTGHRWNNNTFFIVSKIFCFAGLTSIFFKFSWPLETIFGLLNRIFNMSWIAREWSFRVTLDMYVVYAGMLAALFAIKVSEFQWSQSIHWNRVKLLAITVSTFVMVLYFVFELLYNKFEYNEYHPMISILPVLAYSVLRNSTPFLRSVSSNFFAFFGQCSLETFLLQYHLFIAPDTKGILMMIPGTKWRPLNFIVTSTIFVFTSHVVAVATNEITPILSKIRKTSNPLLPIASFTSSSHTTSSASSSTPLPSNSQSSSTMDEKYNSQRDYARSNPIHSHEQSVTSTTPGVTTTAATAGASSSSSSSSSSGTNSTTTTSSSSLSSILGNIWDSWWNYDLRIRFGGILIIMTLLNWGFPSDPPISGHILPTH